MACGAHTAGESDAVLKKTAAKIRCRTMDSLAMTAIKEIDHLPPQARMDLTTPKEAKAAITLLCGAKLSEFLHGVPDNTTALKHKKEQAAKFIVGLISESLDNFMQSSKTEDECFKQRECDITPRRAKQLHKRELMNRQG